MPFTSSNLFSSTNLSTVFFDTTLYFNIISSDFKFASFTSISFFATSKPRLYISLNVLVKLDAYLETIGDLYNIKFTIVLSWNKLLPPNGIIKNNTITKDIKYPFNNDTSPPNIFDGIHNIMVIFTIFWMNFDIFKEIAYIPNNKLNINKNDISWYKKIFNTTSPCIFPEKLKNGKKIHNILPIFSLRANDNTNTIIIPTNDTTSFITPLFSPTIKKIINIRIIPISKMFINVITPILYSL